MPYKDPEQRREYNREYQRKRRAGITAEKKRESLGVRLETAGEVSALIARVIEEVYEKPAIDTVVRARAIGYLCNVILKALEQGDLEERISRLEEVWFGTQNQAPGNGAFTYSTRKNRPHIVRRL